MTATAIPLLNIEDARQAMNWHPDRDAELVPLILEVSSLWESETNRLWGLRTDYDFTTELPWDEKFINLPLYPITSLIVVAWAEGETEPDITDTDEQLVLNSGYSLIAASGEFTSLRHRGSDWFFKDWGAPDQFFKFRITGGYTIETLQSDHPNGPTIKRALLEQLKYQVQRNTPDRVANVNIAVGDGSATLKSNVYHPQFRSAVRTFGNSMIL